MFITGSETLQGTFPHLMVKHSALVGSKVDASEEEEE